MITRDYLCDALETCEGLEKQLKTAIEASRSSRDSTQPMRVLELFTRSQHLTQKIIEEIQRSPRSE